MNSLALFTSRIKSIFRNAGAMSILFLAVIISVVLGIYCAKQQDSAFDVAVIDYDEGDLGLRLLEMVKEDKHIHIVELDEEEALRLMRRDRLQCMFIIRSDFTKKIENLDYTDLIDLTFAPGCSYATSISEPILNSALKLWFEKQTESDFDSLLQRENIEFTDEQRQKLIGKIQSAWEESPSITIEYVTEETKAPKHVISEPAKVAISWFAAFSQLFLILSGEWISHFGQTALRLRLKQHGMSLRKSFSIQALAQMIFVLSAFFLITLFSGALRDYPVVLLYILIYCAGILGISLVVCSLCSELMVLLLVGPELSIATALLSGLLLDIPEWGNFWVIISKILPGRRLYDALSGEGNLLIAFLISAAWLIIGLLLLMFKKSKKQEDL